MGLGLRNRSWALSFMLSRSGLVRAGDWESIWAERQSPGMGRWGGARADLSGPVPPFPHVSPPALLLPPRLPVLLGTQETSFPFSSSPLRAPLFFQCSALISRVFFVGFFFLYLLRDWSLSLIIFVSVENKINF